MTTTTVEDAQGRFLELARSTERTRERTVITDNGRPIVMLVAVDDFESMQETLEILSDRQLMAEIREAEAEVGRGEYESYTHEEMLALIRQAHADGDRS